MTNINNIKVLGNLNGIYKKSENLPFINSNLKVWLNANNGVIYDGSFLVNQWNDLSGNNNFAFQNTAINKPQFFSSFSQLNNNSGLRFLASSDDYMNISYNTGLNFAATGFTIYIVCRTNSYFNTFNMLFQHANGSTWTQGYGILYYTTDNGYRFWVNNWNNSANYVLLSNTNTITSSIFKFKYNLNTISAQIFSNLQPSSNTKAYTGGITTPTTNNFEICRGGSSIYDFNADLGEILIYNTGNLGTANELTTETYLKNKYAIV